MEDPSTTLTANVIITMRVDKMENIRGSAIEVVMIKRKLYMQ